MKKIAITVAILLVIIQITLIVLQIAQIINLPIAWLFAPVLATVLLGTVFMVWYVLDDEKEEKRR